MAKIKHWQWSRRLRLGFGLLMLSALTLVAATGLHMGSLSAPVANAGTVNYFLKLDGITGDATDAQHSGDIALTSFSWGASQPGIVRSGNAIAGRGIDKLTVNDMHFVAPTSSASPKMMAAAISGQHISQAEVLVSEPAGALSQDFYTLTLSDVTITSYKVSGGVSASLPTDEFDLSFDKVQMQYFPQNSDGSLKSPVQSGWNKTINQVPTNL